jgi:hypothetical protein
MERVGCVKVVSGRKRMVRDKRVQTLYHVPLRLPFLDVATHNDIVCSRLLSDVSCATV